MDTQRPLQHNLDHINKKFKYLWIKKKKRFSLAIDIRFIEKMNSRTSIVSKTLAVDFVQISRDAFHD